MEERLFQLKTIQNLLISLSTRILTHNRIYKASAHPSFFSLLTCSSSHQNHATYLMWLILLQLSKSLQSPSLLTDDMAGTHLLMASQAVREWIGINTFAMATQEKLFELLGRLKLENVSTLTILVMGKGGVGKSSTVNSIIGERAVSVSPFQSEVPRPVMVSRSRAGFTLNVIDTPGIIEGGYINDQALEIIKRFLLNKTIDILLYVDRLDAYRVDNLEKQVIKAITDSFGKAIWNRALVVLTHAQFTPPDGLPYDEFCSRRSEALLKTVRAGASFMKNDIQGSDIPVVLVENSGRCKENENKEKILPNKTAWIPHLVETITAVVLNGSKSIFVDKKLIEGPNPNQRGKLLIPFIFALQYLFVVKPIERSIRSDIAKESRPSWETRDTSLASRKY